MDKISIDTSDLEDIGYKIFYKEDLEPLSVGKQESYSMAKETKILVDNLIKILGPEELFEVSKILQKAAMDDIDGSLRQIQEDNEKELDWVRANHMNN